MIRYLPNLDTILWSLKSQEVFPTIEDLKSHLADQRTRICRYIGRPEKSFSSRDVQLIDICARDPFTGWKNYCSIVLDGNIIGFCGE
jgi:hypothetical protein